MTKLNRSQRLVHMMKILVERPGEQIPLSYFTERFGAAKSTVSEDLAFLKESLELDGSGQLRTHAGAIGGVQYWPVPSDQEEHATVTELCRMLSDPARILPGEFLYMTDIITHPVWSARIGEMIAARYISTQPDLVLTIETKGIPLALMVARALGTPMVMARRDARVTEGPSFTTHYISGSSRRISTMTVSTRSLKRDARVLIVDDFMRAGAAARGLVDLVTELGATVVGIAVFVRTAEPRKKRVEEYISLVTLVDVNGEERTVEVHPSMGQR